MIVPVRNEPLLRTFLDSIRVQLPLAEIIVVDTSQTSLLQNRSMGNFRYIHQPGLKTRAKALNAGAKEASKPYFLFLHADCMLSNASLSEIQNVMEEGIKVSAFLKEYFPSSWLLKQQSAYLNRKVLQQGRYLNGTNGLLISRECFFDFKGFPEVSFMEDVRMFDHIRRNLSIHIIQAPLLVSSRKYVSSSALFHMIRNFFIYHLYRLKVPPSLLRHLYP